MKKFALIAALLIGSITAAVAGPHANDTNAQYDRASDVGENGGGGGAGS